MIGRTLRAILVPFLLCTPQARALQPTPGHPAPPVVLNDLHGIPFSSLEERGTVLVLVFGELYHDRTLTACGIIKDRLSEPDLTDQGILPVLVLAQRVPTRALVAEAKDDRLPPKILHDPDRTAFGRYQVSVMPTTIIVDAEGLIVHQSAGLTNRFGDTLSDALLLATGKLTREQFDQRLAGIEAEGKGEREIRAERHAGLARQLLRRGLPDLAAEEYTKALDLYPDLPAARQGIGMLLLRQGRLAEAESHFRTVLEIDPNSLEGGLGLAQVHLRRGGDEIALAEKLVRGVIAHHPDDPRGHYLLGRILQDRADHEGAAAEFRGAAELLMRTREEWVTETVENNDD